MSNGTTRYGGIDLRRGSNFPGHVSQLQADLRELGFLLVGSPTGNFDRATEWAVREFQIYAKMTQVAVEDSRSTVSRYVDRLSSASTDTHQYQGPVSGVVNQATRLAIQHWLDHRWRCPVVVEAWAMSSGRRHNLLGQNLWLHNDVEDTSPRMFVRDFSRYYSFPPTRSQDDLIVLGDFAKYLSWSGPRSVPSRHTWSEGELVPEKLIGASLANLTAAQRSTFKVVRAVSEVECMGFFDSVNSYDNAFVSVGPCHWTLGIASEDRSVAEGELCGYLAYLCHADPAAFQQVFGFFGVRIDKDWVNTAGRPDGAALFSRAQQKYAGWVALRQEDGSFQRLSLREEEGNYFKTWHWFYRFVMAGRTIAGYQQRMWHMARIRIRAILEAPWGGGGTDTAAGGASRIGDVFTSEKAVAILLRWHIRFPAHIVTAGGAGARLHNAVNHARSATPDPNWNGSPGTWTDAHEAALVGGLKTEVQNLGNDDLINTIQAVDDWPAWATGNNSRGYTLSSSIGVLLEQRNSFNCDITDLPPMP